jgi:3-deoxy-D-manno-octulosonic acid kinase
MRHYELVRDERLHLHVRADLSPDLARILRAAASDWSGYDPVAIADGRGGSAIVTPRSGASRVLVRRYLRGGLPAVFVRDLYLGVRPRPFRELRIMKALHENGAPVAEPCGAAVQWLFPGCYRGWLATRFIENAVTLWRWLRDARPSREERLEVLAQVGRSIRQVRRLGIQHADLNLHNVLVVSEPARRIVLIDFDRARRATSTDIGPELARLRRSARKLDPHGAVVTEADFSALHAQSPG